MLLLFAWLFFSLEKFTLRIIFTCWPFAEVSLVIVNSFPGHTGMPSPSQVWIRLPLNRASF